MLSLLRALRAGCDHGSTPPFGAFGKAADLKYALSGDPDSHCTALTCGGHLDHLSDSPPLNGLGSLYVSGRIAALPAAYARALRGKLAGSWLHLLT